VLVDEALLEVEVAGAGFFGAVGRVRRVGRRGDSVPAVVAPAVGARLVGPFALGVGALPLGGAVVVLGMFALGSRGAAAVRVAGGLAIAIAVSVPVPVTLALPPHLPVLIILLGESFVVLDRVGVDVGVAVGVNRDGRPLGPRAGAITDSRRRRASAVGLLKLNQNTHCVSNNPSLCSHRQSNFHFYSETI